MPGMILLSIPDMQIFSVTIIGIAKLIHRGTASQHTSVIVDHVYA